MRFLATGTAIDGLPMPPAQALAAYRASFEGFAAGKDPRITEVYPHADERATTLLIEVGSADELADTLAAIPGYFLSSWDVHPVGTVDATVRLITSMEHAFVG